MKARSQTDHSMSLRLISEQIADHIRCVRALEGRLDVVKAMIDRLAACLESEGAVYLMGNGGSAADAQHIAAELVGRFKRDRRAFRATALTTDSSILTAVSNDYSFDRIFARQIEAWVRPGDVVWALSVSGRSANVLAGLSAAREAGATCIGFTGKDGGAMAALCDLCLEADHVASDRVQEMHQLAYHMVCGELENRLAQP